MGRKGRGNSTVPPHSLPSVRITLSDGKGVLRKMLYKL